MTLEPLLDQLAELVAVKVAARLNGKPQPEADRLLDVHDAADLLGVKPRWLYRRAKSLPFAKRLSPGVLRFSEAGLRAYMAAGRRGSAA
jgi:predicted DNA-binding transcriptional regulator AlpA